MIPEALARLTEVFPLPKVLVAVAVLGVPPLMVEVGYHHHKGNFHRAAMYVPIAFPPFFAAAGLLLLGTDARWAYWTFAAASAGLLLMGLLGTFYHLQGLARQTGGFTLDNLLVGPPLGAPGSFSLLAILGFLALAYWPG